MNRKQLILALLFLTLVVAIIPFRKSRKVDEDPTQKAIDSVQVILDSMTIENQRANAQLRIMLDSLNELNVIIENKSNNYLTLKKQNEKLQQERSILIRGFSDADIERYLSKRYGK